MVLGANYFVAMHGAGVANTLWLNPGATVVEIFPDHFEKPTYEKVSGSRKEKHRPAKVSQYVAWAVRAFILLPRSTLTLARYAARFLTTCDM